MKTNLLKKFLIIILAILNFYFSISTPIIAQITNPVMPHSNRDIAHPESFVNRLLKTVVGIFFLVGVFYFLWHLAMGAYHLIATEGDKNKYQTAKDELTHAFIGLTVLFSLFAILKLIGIIFGIDSLSEDLKLSLPSL